MKKSSYLYLLSFLFLSNFYCSAQSNTKKISGSYQDFSIANVISDIEAKSNITFFFKKEWLESKKVTVQFDEASIDEVVDILFMNQNLTYILRKPNYVIILPDEGSSSEVLMVDNSVSSAVSIGSVNISSEKANISGFVVYGESNTPLNGTVISVNEQPIRYVTGVNGYYEFVLPVGNHKLKFHHPTMVDYDISITLNSDGKLNILMFEDVTLLDEVTISTQALDQNVSKTLAGKEIIDIQTIKTIPAFFGEADVFNSVLSLPGVSKVGEGSSGINVRGGGVGQNLILIDNSTIYNSAHLFGFFSAFNADAVNQVSFYRGSIPVEYGGRLSSVMDVEIKSGNKSKVEGVGGVGFVNSKLLVEGPIRKDTTSFLAAVRAAYPSYIIQLLEDQDLSNSAAFFGDANLRIDHMFSLKNRIALSGYLSRDRFDFSNEAEYNYGNKTLGIEWYSQLTNNTFLKSTGSFTSYNYTFKEISDPILASSLEAGVKEFSLDNQFQIDSEKHTTTYGVDFKAISIIPGTYSKESPESILEPLTINQENGIETAIFLGDEFNLNDKLSFYGGLRYSFYTGGKNEIKDTFHGSEPRFSVNYQTTPTSSVKLGYNRMRQYIHFISNTTSATPIDLWKLSNEAIKPGIADQISLGYFRNFNSNLFETSVEVFYKKTKNLIEYKNGADLFLNENIEDELIQGEGKAYGLEFLVKKTNGDLTGWISYTLSRSLIQVAQQEPSKPINNGDFFPTNFDQPHNISAFTSLRMSRRFTINANFTYNSGRPISYPESVYSIRGITVADFASRNKYRIPDYNRLDISFVLASSLKRVKKVEANWSISIYNVYGRKNTYSVYFKNDPVTGQPESYKLAVIAKQILAISYNFKF